MPPAEPGRTRQCPHCKSTILESADVCPACHHHLRFGADRGGARSRTSTVFRVDGVVRPPDAGDAWEYEVVVALYDEQGAELAREVVHVGALRAPASRRCVVSIEAHAAEEGATAERTRGLAVRLRRP
jgi:hypothetical protein